MRAPRAMARRPADSSDMVAEREHEELMAKWSAEWWREERLVANAWMRPAFWLWTVCVYARSSLTGTNPSDSWSKELGVQKEVRAIRKRRRL